MSPRVPALGAAVFVAIASQSAPGASSGLILHEAGRRDDRRNVVTSALDSETWLGMQVHYLRHVPLERPDRDLMLGGSLEIPAMLWLQGGGADTGRVSIRAAWAMAPTRRVRLVFDTATRLAAQHDFMGTLVAWDLKLAVLAGLHFSRASVGLALGWQQGLSTLVLHSDYVRDAYRDRYPATATGGIQGPTDGWIAFPGARLSGGLQGGFDLSSTIAIFAAGELIVTPADYDAGLFDTMMFGVWPFLLEAGIALRF